MCEMLEAICTQLTVDKRIKTNITYQGIYPNIVKHQHHNFIKLLRPSQPELAL